MLFKKLKGQCKSISVILNQDNIRFYLGRTLVRGGERAQTIWLIGRTCRHSRHLLPTKALLPEPDLMR